MMPKKADKRPDGPNPGEQGEIPDGSVSDVDERPHVSPAGSTANQPDASGDVEEEFAQLAKILLEKMSSQMTVAAPSGAAGESSEDYRIPRVSSKGKAVATSRKRSHDVSPPESPPPSSDELDTDEEDIEMSLADFARCYGRTDQVSFLNSCFGAIRDGIWLIFSIPA